MDVQIDEPLKFWVEAEIDAKSAIPVCEQIAENLAKYESFGAAMCERGPDNELVWKATPSLIQHLHDMEENTMSDSHSYEV